MEKKQSKFVAFEGVSFNSEWMKTKTFAEFFEHEKHHGISREKMKEFYDSIKNPKPAEVKAAEEKPVEAIK